MSLDVVTSFGNFFVVDVGIPKHIYAVQQFEKVNRLTGEPVGKPITWSLGTKNHMIMIAEALSRAKATEWNTLLESENHHGEDFDDTTWRLLVHLLADGPREV